MILTSSVCTRPGPNAVNIYARNLLMLVINKYLSLSKIV